MYWNNQLITTAIGAGSLLLYALPKCPTLLLLDSIYLFYLRVTSGLRPDELEPREAVDQLPK